MKIGIISDVHDDIIHLLTALHEAKKRKCERLLFAGDIVSLSTLLALCEEWSHPLDIVFGNNEYDHENHLNAAKRFPHVVHHGQSASLSLDGKRLFMTHLPQRALAQLPKKKYDVIVFGHTHIARCEIVGSTRLINPGEVCGFRSGQSSIAVYDTALHAAQPIVL